MGYGSALADRDTAFRFGIAAESGADARIVARMVDLVLEREVDWFGDQRSTLRRWCGLHEGTDYLDSHGYNEELHKANIRLQGRFGGGLEERQLRGLMILFERSEKQPHALVICRDTDGRPERRTAAERAMADARCPFPVTVAMAHPELEAWLIAGFEPETDAERDTHRQLRTSLGFDPLAKSHELSATSDVSKRDCKRVLAALVADDRTRRERCVDGAIELSGDRGQGNGLASFVEDVRKRIAPLLGGRGSQTPD